MSLYDDAGLISLPTGAAGKGGLQASGSTRKGVVYNIKPVEKLKVDELVTNGTFYDNDSEGAWTPGSNSPTFSNNQVTFQHSGGSNVNRHIRQSGVFEGGKTYKVSLNVVELKEGAIRIGTGPNSVEITSAVNGGPIVTPGNHSFVYTNQGRSGDDILHIQAADVGEPYDFTIDNVSVREVEQEAKDFQFTRSSNLTATRVGPGGLIEKGRENLLKYSNGFDNALWEGHATGNTLISTVTGGQAGYDGSNNAFLLNKDTSDLFKRREQVVAETAGVVTFSVYAKAGTASSITLRGGSDDNANVQNGNDDQANFDLANGTSSTVNDSITSSMEAIHSGGWYRCSVVFRDPTQLVQIYINFNSESTGTVFIQNAQLENGLVATDYIDSGGTTGKAGILEDEPRFDYTGGGCPGLLIEDQSINLVRYSEYFGDYVETNTTISDTLETSPEGVKNAYKVLETSATNASHKFVAPEPAETYTHDATYSVSVFAKAAGRTKFRLQAGIVSEFPFKADFTLTGDGTAIAQAGNDTNSTVSIENYGNGWYRCKIEGFTIDLDEGTGTGGTKRNIFLLDDSGNDTYDGDTSKGVIFYGYQLEESSFATSYIPNHGTSGGATRIKDDVDRLEGLTVDGLTNGYNTTIYCKFKMIYDAKSVANFLFNYLPTVSGALAADPRLLLYTGASGSGNFSVKMQYRVGGNISTNDLVIQTHTNAADGYNVGDAVKAIARITDFGVTLFVNGTKYTYENNGLTSGRPFLKSFAGLTPDAIDIAVQDNQRGHELLELITFPKALTDDECIDLTT